jgi:hypothetical protein
MGKVSARIPPEPSSRTRCVEQLNAPVKQLRSDQLLHLGTLLEEVDKQLKTALNSLSRGGNRAGLLLEASQIWLVCAPHFLVSSDFRQAAYHAISRQRETAGSLYRVDAHALSSEAWTSRAALIDALQFLFEADYQTVTESARDRGVPVTQDTGDLGISELKTSMTELAEFLLGMYEERLLFLQRWVSSSSPNGAD